MAGVKSADHFGFARWTTQELWHLGLQKKHRCSQNNSHIHGHRFRYGWPEICTKSAEISRWGVVNDRDRFLRAVLLVCSSLEVRMIGPREKSGRKGKKREGGD